MNAPNNSKAGNSYLTAQYMRRSRVDSILDQATSCKLVYVIAGTGYGKTQAVSYYMEGRQDAIVKWLQLTDSDNIGSHYWEGFTHIISADDSDLAAKLREFGFPETSARFKQLAGIIKNSRRRSKKGFLVFDDFHLIHSQEVSTFMERCINLQIPDLCIVILSRKEPEINVMSLISKGNVGIVTEEDLKFTAAEATDFFMQCGVPLSLRDLSQLMDTTKGWPLALNMLSAILEKMPNSYKYALSTMMQNIFKFLETEAWENFSEDVQKSIVKLSLLSDLPSVPVQNFFKESELLQNTPMLSSFIWFGHYTDNLKIYPLYLEFLQSKLDILSDAEKEETYYIAAQWCCENAFYMDAVAYYAKMRRFDCIVKTLLSYPFKLPRDASEYFLHVLENIEEDSESQSDVDFLLLKNFFVPLLLVGAGNYDRAQECSMAAIKKWEHVDSPVATMLMYISYSNLAYIDTYNCTVTHKYNAPEYLKKSVEYFKRSKIVPGETAGAFINADIRSFACLVGEGAGLQELEQFLEAARQTARYNEETRFNMYAGYEDLVACEYAFFKNQPDVARRYAHSAMVKAQDKKQYSISALAEKYLLRIAVQEGDAMLVREILKKMHSYLEIKDFWNGQLYYDLYTGAFYASIGVLEPIAQWLVLGEKEVASAIKVPSRELFVSVSYYIAAKKYQQALTMLNNSCQREPRERFLFGEIRILLLTAVSLIRTGDTSGALNNFEKAYRMSFDGIFEMFFIELGKELHPLVIAALDSKDCDIPEQWLKTIERRASIYAKKAAVVAGVIKRDLNIKESVSLSEREREILSDLYHGLSREEIADNRYLSINTVKKTLQSIYIKLDAANNVDAIRVALERRLIE